MILNFKLAPKACQAWTLLPLLINKPAEVRFKVLKHGQIVSEVFGQFFCGWINTGQYTDSQANWVINDTVELLHDQVSTQPFVVLSLPPCNLNKIGT